MKQVEFSEDQLGNLDLIAATLFEDPNDPRSRLYQRKLVRPWINWLGAAIHSLLPLAVAFGLYWALLQLGMGSGAAVGVCFGVVGLYILLRLKHILIFLVQVYQRFAPTSLRNKCRFEPSCSEYMILSLQKYGLWKGLRKGVNRLTRCNVKDGGFDHP